MVARNLLMRLGICCLIVISGAWGVKDIGHITRQRNGEKANPTAPQSVKETQFYTPDGELYDSEQKYDQNENIRPSGKEDVESRLEGYGDLNENDLQGPNLGLYDNRIQDNIAGAVSQEKRLNDQRDGVQEQLSVPRGLPPVSFSGPRDDGGYGRGRSAYIHCYSCSNSFAMCGNVVKNYDGMVHVTKCRTKCFLRIEEHGAISRDCFDGWASISSLRSDYNGCKPQKWGGRVMNWCFCSGHFCNGQSEADLGGPGYKPFFHPTDPLARPRLGFQRGGHSFDHPPAEVFPYPKQTRSRSPQRTLLGPRSPRQREDFQSATPVHINAIQCQEVGFTGDPNNCQKFYGCNYRGRNIGHAVMHTFYCPAKLQWDNHRKECVRNSRTCPPHRRGTSFPDYPDLPPVHPRPRLTEEPRANLRAQRPPRDRDQVPAVRPRKNSSPKIEEDDEEPFPFPKSFKGTSEREGDKIIAPYEKHSSYKDRGIKPDEVPYEKYSSYKNRKSKTNDYSLKKVPSKKESIIAPYEKDQKQRKKTREGDTYEQGAIGTLSEFTPR